jgi:LSD1 subclass zinc finger protein
MSNDTSEKTADINKVKCKDCGAFLTYKVGTTNLKCEYCNAENEIKTEAAVVEELDFNAYVAQLATAPDQQQIHTVKCGDCGASTTLKPNVQSDSCPYCATPLVIANATTQSIIKPSTMLAFKIERRNATELFEEWVGGLWFAPGDLKMYAKNSADKLNGMYLPYWTYDSNTYSTYSGARGDHYYDTEYYTDTEGNEQSREVMKTLWTPVSGWVNNSFDDILVCATKALPDKVTRELEPWDLDQMIGYNESYLSGFKTESYSVDLPGGWEVAKGVMKPTIDDTVRRDIGGDVQTIATCDTQYNDITFKHVLLPMWLSAYKYDAKVFRFMINARTGEVQGERPYSFWKIFFFVLTILAVIGAAIFFIMKYKKG